MYWVSPGSEFNIFPPDGIKDGGEKSKSKDRGFLSITVNDIAAQKNKGSPRSTEAQILGARNVSEKTTVRCFSYADSRTSASRPRVLLQLRYKRSTPLTVDQFPRINWSTFNLEITVSITDS